MRAVIKTLTAAAALFPVAASVGAQQPPTLSQVEPPGWMLSIADSVDCLRGVDANPLFAAVKVHTPSAEAMGLAHIDDKAKPTPREQEILVRYAEAASTCIPFFDEADPDPMGQAAARLVNRLWGEQTALLRKLAEGNLAWGRYNRDTMQLDRTLRRELAALRKPAPPKPDAPKP
jgi:hypothetical protein